MKKHNIFLDLMTILFFTSIFFVCYLLFYNQAFNGYSSDLIHHIGFIDEFINGNKYIPHPMFHYTTYYLSKALSIDIRLSGVIVNALLVTVLSLIIYKILLVNLRSLKTKYFLLFLVFVVIFSGNFFLPGLGLTRYHYLGNGSIGVWHNVTLYTVKPFAFLSFFGLFYAIQHNNRANFKILFISCLAAILSILAKPSFIITYVPMLFLLATYMIFNRSKYRLKFSSVLYYFIIVFFVTSILFVNQYLNLYVDNEDNSSIIIAPFKFWSTESDNVIVSIFVSNMFVITFLYFAFKHLSLRSSFSIIMLFGGIAVFALFAEAGPRFSHGNLGWIYLTAQPIAYLSVIIDFVNRYSLIKPFSRNILLLTLSLHIVGGVYYFIKIFNGMSYA